MRFLSGKLRRWRARFSPVSFIRSHGWSAAYLDDGYGDSGWFAYLGDYNNPVLETGVYETEAEAARVAIETWPSEFASPQHVNAAHGLDMAD